MEQVIAGTNTGTDSFDYGRNYRKQPELSGVSDFTFWIYGRANYCWTRQVFLFLGELGSISSASGQQSDGRTGASINALGRRD